MKDAVREFPVRRIVVQEMITVQRKASRALEGSCNACNACTSSVGDTVTRVDLRGMSFRLCSACRTILKKAL
jgi:hypothetical protein